jgi:hypothetical protein
MTVVRDKEDLSIILGTASLQSGSQWPVQRGGYLVMDQMQGQDCLLGDVSSLILLSLQTLQMEGSPSTCKVSQEPGSVQQVRTLVCTALYSLDLKCPPKAYVLKA